MTVWKDKKIAITIGMKGYNCSPFYGKLKLKNMTALVIIQAIIILVFIGIWICYKRDWYKPETFEGPLYILGTIIFMPIALIIALVREFFIKDWSNDK